MTDVVIVEALRTPVGRRGGGLSSMHPAELLAAVQTAVVERSGMDPAEIGQVVGGCVSQVGAQSANIARTAWLGAGLPQSVAATTVDSQCGSSQQAFNVAVNLVASGAEDVAMACGIEHMSMVPLGASAVDGVKGGHGKPINRTYGSRYELTSQFEGAERIATKYGISRADTDEPGLES